MVTLLYLSIINVLCGAGGDASFAPQVNLVSLFSWVIQLVLPLFKVALCICLCLECIVSIVYIIILVKYQPVNAMHLNVVKIKPLLVFKKTLQSFYHFNDMSQPQLQLLIICLQYVFR